MNLKTELPVLNRNKKLVKSAMYLTAWFFIFTKVGQGTLTLLCIFIKPLVICIRVTSISLSPGLLIQQPRP
jgi:hypothetical protein